MAKKVKAIIKLQIEAGKATAAYNQKATANQTIVGGVTALGSADYSFLQGK